MTNPLWSQVKILLILTILILANCWPLSWDKVVIIIAIVTYFSFNSSWQKIFFGAFVVLFRAFYNLRTLGKLTLALNYMHPSLNMSDLLATSLSIIL